MKRAEQLVDKLLEDGEALDWERDPSDPDDVGPKDVGRLSASAEFDEGAEEIVFEARQMYLEAVKIGLLKTAKGTAKGLTGYDASSVAQAFLQLAMERRGAPGATRFLKALKRYGHY